MDDWLPQLVAIDDPIADDYWSYEDDNEAQHIVRVTVGRPAPIPNDSNGDWYCPVRIEPGLPAIRCMVGVGPVDALINGSRLVKNFFAEFRKVSSRAQPMAGPSTPRPT